MRHTGRVQGEAAGDAEMGQLDMRQGQLAVGEETFDAVQRIADVCLCLVDRPGNGALDPVPHRGGGTLDAVKYRGQGALHGIEHRGHLGFDPIHHCGTPLKKW